MGSPMKCLKNPYIAVLIVTPAITNKIFRVLLRGLLFKSLFFCFEKLKVTVAHNLFLFCCSVGADELPASVRGAHSWDAGESGKRGKTIIAA